MKIRRESRSFRRRSYTVPPFMILPSARLGCCLPVGEVDPASMTSMVSKRAVVVGLPVG